MVDCVPVVVREEVRLAEAVRLGVRVPRALTVLDCDAVCVYVPVTVSVPVIEPVCVVVRVPVTKADGLRLAVTLG